VSIEGTELGRIDGLRFVADRDAGAHPSQRRLAQRAVEPEVARRLGRLAADADEAFAVLPDGAVTWCGELVARVTNEDPWSARVRLIGDQGVEAARERARRRIEAWLAQEAGRALRGLSRLKRALESGGLKGLTRGLAFRLVESGGVLARRDVEGELAALSQVERRTLKTFGVRVGAHSVWLPADQKARGRGFAQAFWAREGSRADAPRALSARGLRAAGGLTLPLETLERLSELRAAGQGVLDATALAELGLSEAQAQTLAKALRAAREKPRAGVGAASPFAALAGLAAPPEQTRKRRPRRRRAS
jgi:ATP-dependent RNA helicase SUPV3L1/SUV3